MARFVRLTPAESRFATALLHREGSLCTLGEELGVAYVKTRPQMASLFEKAGARSETQLIKLLMWMGAWLLRSARR